MKNNIKRSIWFSGSKLSLIRLEVALPAPASIVLGSIIAGVGLRESLVLILIGICIKFGANLIGEAMDYKLDIIDRPEAPTTSGIVKRKSVLLGSIFLDIVAFSVAWIYFLNLYLIAILLIMLLFIIMYTTPPLYFKKRGWYGIGILTTVFSLFFLMPFTIGVPQNIPDILFWFSFLFFNTFIAVLCKDFKDYRGDKAMGVLTPIVKYSPKRIASFVIYTTLVPLLAVFYIKEANMLSLLIAAITFVPIKFRLIGLLKNPMRNKEKIASISNLDRLAFPLVFSFLIWLSM